MRFQVDAISIPNELLTAPPTNLRTMADHLRKFETLYGRCVSSDQDIDSRHRPGLKVHSNASEDEDDR